MADLGSIGLVLAGSAGPIVIAVMNARSARSQEVQRWRRDDRSRTLDLYARFLGACTQIVADWGDYAKLPPRSADEERELDERRDVHYGDLNALAAMVRIAAPPAVAHAAEDVLATVRHAREAALQQAQTAGRGAADHAWAGVETRFAASRQAFVDTARTERDAAARP